MGDELHLPRLGLQMLEGDTIGRIQGERDQELPPGLHLNAARERGAAGLDLHGHGPLDPAFEGLERCARGGVIGVDGEGNLPFLERPTQIPLTSESLGLLPMARGQALARRRRSLGKRRAPNLGLRRRLLRHGGAGARRERQSQGQRARGRRPAHHLRVSGW